MVSQPMGYLVLTWAVLPGLAVTRPYCPRLEVTSPTPSPQSLGASQKGSCAFVPSISVLFIVILHIHLPPEAQSEAPAPWQVLPVSVIGTR